MEFSFEESQKMDLCDGKIIEANIISVYEISLE